MNSTWLPVASCPGYEVSPDGVVRSVRRSTPVIRKPSPDRHGYLQVYLTRDGRKTWRLVHHLVTEAFHGPRPEGLLIRHLDGDKTNNAASNLAYGTASENQLDAVRHGTHRNAKKTHCANGHPYDTVSTRFSRGKRECRPCNAAAARRYKARKRAVA